MQLFSLSCTFVNTSGLKPNTTSRTWNYASAGIGDTAL
ncbi:hypothetical protein RTCIAT899_PC07865 (plasmid) [Rhizobium tropici CIAT 899]|nr:hypothetical protein RTCIAT899_PC07865 [Rhizobium tropici CIAT 899]